MFKYNYYEVLVEAYVGCQLEQWMSENEIRYKRSDRHYCSGRTFRVYTVDCRHMAPLVVGAVNDQIHKLQSEMKKEGTED